MIREDTAFAGPGAATLRSWSFPTVDAEVEAVS